MDTHEAQRLVDVLVAAFPGTAMREQTPSLYTKFLTGLDRETTGRVIDDLIANSTAFPTIAEIRRGVFETQLQLPTPLEAWRAASTRGIELHSLVREVCDLFGGTYNLRAADEPTIIRAQFLKAYGERRDETLREANTKRFRRAA